MASRSSACARAGLRSLPAPDGRHPVLPLLSYSSTSGASPAPRARSQRSLARGSWGGSTSSALSPGCPAKLPSCVATLPALPAAPAHRASLFPPGHSTLLPFCTQCEPFSRPAADKVSSAVALPLCELLSLGLGVEGDRQPVRTGGSRRPRGCQRLHCLLSPPLPALPAPALEGLGSGELVGAAGRGRHLGRLPVSLQRCQGSTVLHQL